MIQLIKEKITWKICFEAATFKNVVKVFNHYKQYYHCEMRTRRGEGIEMGNFPPSFFQTQLLPSVHLLTIKKTNLKCLAKVEKQIQLPHLLFKM